MRAVASATGWVPVHPVKGTDWCALTMDEDRPRYPFGFMPGWRWTRVIVRIDEHDQPADAPSVG